mmetsp:Transcript_4429/g.9577  ORF Transcript_4429/g.9577 Transcript_4429/m.9577 type:complete len:189 (+) Transcript_4429:145-711(+)|eukprot:CAMPEP_0172555188 /NCGR_PEP_ID=MMETSP1067-20121228/58289_1 /TAXON_ID=265564 ORGANISM="Thalassiosira punctigera, Strain Tpunct2005C2" /NCGR_SAMPLE_ID=MMETSP1067 /ASSEMBLY_ACC=CAM_ASM_000444 /LENGTH=188 /DNA_ID=CAMNT_0013343701 /DNA_START=103 /DNA_END=669 /DNA_ORIENTATION=-
MKTPLLLLCARYCQPFSILPSPIDVATKAHRSTSLATAFNSKGGSVDGSDNNGDDQWEWDGVVVEGAHDAEFESVDAADNFMPSMSLMSMASSVTSPALASVVGSGGEGAAVEFDQFKNSGKLHRIAMEKEFSGGEGGMSGDDLLEMGGDPAFLDDAEDMEAEGLGMEKDDADFFAWDGEVDEDAHLD